MAPPSIYGEPKITHNQEKSSVLLECIVTGADSSKTKWYYGDNELEEESKSVNGGGYTFSHTDEGGNRKKFSCEIKVLFL